MTRRHALPNKLLAGALVLLLTVLIISMAFAQTATADYRAHPQTRPRPALTTSFFGD